MEQAKKNSQQHARTYRKPYQLIFGGLFLRTFLLIALLITVSLMAWFQSFRVIEREPRALHIALQFVSIVKLTKTALLYSDPNLIKSLLQDLESNTGVRVYSRSESDRYVPQPNGALDIFIKRDIRARLGQHTIIAQSVNGIPGVWISFKINNDKYWLALDQQQLDESSNLQWLGWSIFAFALSLCGAALITRLVNLPFSLLATAANKVGRGLYPKPLPANGKGVIADTNRSFNRMIKELEQLETDRSLMLAGISHDIKTPLARLRLEAEMSASDPTCKEAMINDIEQIDQIINAFIDYARPNKRTLKAINLSSTVEKYLEPYQQNDQFIIQSSLTKNVFVFAKEIDIQRILNNIIANAQKYGIHQADQKVHLDINLIVLSESARLSIADHGSGIDEQYIHLVTRPFYRVNSARSQADGTGLGMAIVQRIVSRLGGSLSIQNVQKHSGLEVIIELPLSK